MNFKKVPYVFFLFVYLVSIHAQPQLGKRTPFDIPLLALTVKSDKTSPGRKQVSITINGSKEFAVIAPLNDHYIKHKRMETKKLVYAESEVNSHNLTKFEATELAEVIRSLLSTLEIFERDLAQKRWGKCLYLDAYFPRFLRGFYHLSNAAFDTDDALPAVCNISESLFDVSLRSIKSDYRVFKWQKKKDHVIKLRIATKELIYQLKGWEKKNLGSFNKKSEVFSYDEKLRNAFSLFVKVYFHIY